MKVQKMLFFTHGWHLATTGQPGITSQFEAWPYGPVVDEIYHDLKKFSSSPVSEYIKDEASGKAFVVNDSCKDILQSIDIAWEKYVGIPAVNLSAMTHEPGSPWDITKKSGRTFIDNNEIREYFVRLARK